MSFNYFLGIGNDGCLEGPPPCGTGEFPCPVGQECIQGVCLEVNTGAGGASQ